MILKANNHFVPRFYLKNFSEDGNKIWAYRTLVDCPKIPNWKILSIKKKAARQKHLYTSTIAGQENDQLENWLEQEIETSAAEVISKIISNSRISKKDWRILSKFLASQRVRTPAYYIQSRSDLEKNIPNLMRECLENKIKKLEDNFQEDQQIKSELLNSPTYYSPIDLLPFKVKKNIDQNKKSIKLQTEILLGRETWIFQIKHTITHTAKILNQHKWTILCPPQNMSWVTSDNPVIQLNFLNYNNYNLSGGWNSKGTELMISLSPKHLLYTQIGHKVPRKGTKLSSDKFKFIQKIIAENAHRMIFASQQDIKINDFRKREVNVEKFQHEQQEWIKWHKEQTIAELDFT